MCLRRRALISIATFFAVDGRAVPTPEPCEWDSLVADAALHSVLPGLWGRMRDLDLADDIPPEVAAALEAIHHANSERNNVILDQARAIIARFNESAIEPVALKGLAYLLTKLYPDDGERYLLDLDFLIPANQMSEAIAVLTKAGYQADADDPLGMHRHHAPRMQRVGCAPIELHHSLAIGSDAALLQAGDVFRASERLLWRGVSVRVPSSEHLATHLILHSQFQHAYQERIWPPLRALVDLEKLNERLSGQVDWKFVARRFQAANELGTLQLHLLHAHEVLGIQFRLNLDLALLTRLRWQRRRLLFRHPRLRFVDPSYWLLAMLSRRFRLFRAVCATPGAWRDAGKILLKASLYKRLLAEVTHQNSF